jgi:hypothetical protein
MHPSLVSDCSLSSHKSTAISISGLDRDRNPHDEVAGLGLKAGVRHEDGPFPLMNQSFADFIGSLAIDPRLRG